MRKLLLAGLCAAFALSPVYAKESNESKKSNVTVGAAIDMDLSVVAQYQQFNFVLGDNGAAVDYIFKEGLFDQQPKLSWYLGGGGFVGWDHGYGVRVPVGIDWNFYQGWQAFAQVHPQLDFDDDTDFGVKAAIGVRYGF